MANCSRRKLFKIAGAGSLALLLPTFAKMNNAFAQTGEQLDPENAQAKALGYKHDTNEVDNAAYPTHDVSQRCDNCQLAQGVGKEWIGCALFPGKQVAAGGWCSAWVAAQ